MINQNVPDEPRGGTGSSRRRFLQGISAGAVAGVVGAGSAPLLQNAAAAQTTVPEVRKKAGVQLRRARLPVLRQADVVVAGGSVAGVAAALRFARAGRSVVLIEHRNYLGREVSATLKPWVDLGRLSAGEVPEVIAATLKKQMTTEMTGEIPLWMDAFKVTLENLLLDAGVGLVYGSLPTEAVVMDGVIRGVVVGNKSGRQVVLGHMIVDATPTALVARLAGAEFAPETPADFHFVRMMEMEDVWPLEKNTLDVPAELGIAGNRLTVHNGYRGNGHVLIEAPMELKLGHMDLDGMMQREIEASAPHDAPGRASDQNVAKFKDGKLAICAYELDGPQTTRLAGPAPAWAAEFDAAGLEFADKNQEHVRVHLDGLAGPVKGLWCLNESARLDRDQQNHST